MKLSLAPCLFALTACASVQESTNFSADQNILALQKCVELNASNIQQFPNGGEVREVSFVHQYYTITAQTLSFNNATSLVLTLNKGDKVIMEFNDGDISQGVPASGKLQERFTENFRVPGLYSVQMLQKEYEAVLATFLHNCAKNIPSGTFSALR